MSAGPETWHPEVLDTRKKIVDRGAIPPDDNFFVSGWFDPLVAAHAQRLAELRASHDRLVIVILDPPKPVLSTRARAELVASLAAVDYVVIGGDAEVHLEAEHALLFDELVAHAAARNALTPSR